MCCASSHTIGLSHFMWTFQLAKQRIYLPNNLCTDFSNLDQVFLSVVQNRFIIREKNYLWHRVRVCAAKGLAQRWLIASSGGSRHLVWGRETIRGGATTGRARAKVYSQTGWGAMAGFQPDPPLIASVILVTLPL